MNPRRARAQRAWGGLLAAVLALAALALQAPAAAEERDAAGAAARWAQLQKALFAGHEVHDGAQLVTIDAPQRALDASLVPVELQITDPARVRGVYLIIDENPAPLAAHFVFGPQADPHRLELRVRVNQYTDIHAVAETTDGQLYASARYVKAAGGCSAPAGSDDAQALADIGRMKLRMLGAVEAGKPVQAQLMIRHPNFNGMQMDQVKRTYTPARFIRTIEANYGGREIFHLDADISLSTDPVITFGFVPQAQGQVEVVVQDSSESVFRRSFDVPGG